MENSKTLLTRGQASCLALSMCPTDDNRKKAKDILNASPFDVVYLQDYSPLIPVAIGKDAKSMNPFLYCSYPETPPNEQLLYEEEDQSTDNNSITCQISPQEKRSIPVTSSKLAQSQPEVSGSDDIETHQNLNQCILQNNGIVFEKTQRSTIVKNPKSAETKTFISNRRRATSLKRMQYQLVPKKTILKAAAENSLSKVKETATVKHVTDPLLKTVKRSILKLTDSLPAKTSKRANLKRTNFSSSEVMKHPILQLPEEPPLSNTVNKSQKKVQINTEDYSIEGPVASRNKILNFLKKVLLVNKPESPHFELQFVTSAIQLQIAKESLNVGSLTQKKLACLVSRADIFSYCINFNGERGRWLYVMKKQYREIHKIY